MTQQKIILRAPEPADTDRLYLWENASETAHVTLFSQPLSRHALAQYIDRCDTDIHTSGQLRLMIALPDNPDVAIGTIDITDYDNRNRHGCVSIFVAAPYRRKGYGHAALTAIEDYMRQTIGAHMLMALVAYDNTASRALFASAGYSTCGSIRSFLRHGNQYRDVLVFQKLMP